MTSIQTTWKTAVVSAGLMFSALLTACGGGTDQLTDPAQSQTSDPAEPGWIMNHSGNPMATASGDVASGSTSVEGGSVEAAGSCTYIQWCDEPGAWGTVCRAKAGCASDGAIVAQCDADVRAVCGRAVNPKRIDFY